MQQYATPQLDLMFKFVGKKEGILLYLGLGNPKFNSQTDQIVENLPKQSFWRERAEKIGHFLSFPTKTQNALNF